MITRHNMRTICGLCHVKLAKHVCVGAESKNNGKQSILVVVGRVIRCNDDGGFAACLMNTLRTQSAFPHLNHASVDLWS